jgi:hypothetical protein
MQELNWTRQKEQSRRRGILCFLVNNHAFWDWGSFVFYRDTIRRPIKRDASFYMKTQHSKSEFIFGIRYINIQSLRHSEYADSQLQRYFVHYLFYSFNLCNYWPPHTFEFYVPLHLGFILSVANNHCSNAGYKSWPPKKCCTYPCFVGGGMDTLYESSQRRTVQEKYGKVHQPRNDIFVGLGMNLGDLNPGLVSAFSYHGYFGLGRDPVRSPLSCTRWGPPSSKRGEWSRPDRVGATVTCRCHDTALMSVLDDALRASTRAVNTWRSDTSKLRARASSRPAGRWKWSRACLRERTVDTTK